MRYVQTRESLLADAISQLHAWCLLLRFRATPEEEEDCSQISQALPWFWRLSRELRDFFSMESLRRDGFALLVCDGPVEALQLAGGVKGCRVVVQVFDPEGNDVRGPHSSC